MQCTIRQELIGNDKHPFALIIISSSTDRVFEDTATDKSAETVSTMSDSAEEVHVLEHKWEISEQYQLDDKQEKGQGYENSFEKICTFDTIEQFWGYWNKIPGVS